MSFMSWEDVREAKNTQTANLQTLYGLLLGDANVLLLERHRTEAVVKEEETFAGVHTEECSDVLVVGECGTQTNETDLVLGCLHLTQCAHDDGLEDRSTILVQQVDLVHDDETDEGLEAALRLARDNIPLLRRAHDDLTGSVGRMDAHETQLNLSVVDLLLAQLLVSSQLSHLDAVVCKALAEVSNHLLHERLHGGDVDDL